MNACEEMLIASDLRELLGNKRAPDLIERTLQRLREPIAAPVKEEATLHALPAWRWQPFAIAASVLLALGLVVWLTLPRALPEGVSVARGASYSVRADHIELSEGVLLLSTGAPEVRVNGQRVSGVNGKSVVRAGGIPDAKQLAALEELPLTKKEMNMLWATQRWTVAAGLALCVLSGSAMLNDRVIEAAPEEVEGIPNLEMTDTAGLIKLLGKARSITVTATKDGGRTFNGVEVSDSAAVKELIEAATSELAHPFGAASPPYSNICRFHLEGGDILVQVDFTDRWKRGSDRGTVYISLPQWSTFCEYQVRGDLLRRFEPWLAQALAQAPAESPKPEDIKGIQDMLEKTTRVTVRGRDRNFSMCSPVEVTNASEVKELVDAIYSNLELAKAPAGWDSGNQIAFHLRDGREIEIMVNIKEGLADLRLAGWERYYEYNVRADLLQRFQRSIDLSATYGPDCPAPAGMRKLRGFSGADSKIDKKEFAVAKGQAQLDEFWKRHAPGTTPPSIDFSKEWVLGIFQGKGWNSRGVRLVEILEDQLSKPEEFIVRFDEISYQTSGGADSVSAYGIFVLTRSDAAVRVEENVQGLIGRPPLWQRYLLDDDFKLTRGRSAAPSFSRLRGWEGEGSKIGGAAHYLIESQEEWKELWEKHAPGTTPPEVDFDKEVVAAILQSVPEGWGGVAVTELYASNARAIMHVRAATWQSDGGPEKLTMSYGFHVFPKALKLVLETPSYRNLGEEARWLETAWR